MEKAATTFRRHAARLGTLFLLCLLLASGPGRARAETVLPLEEAEEVLSLLREGSGKITSFHADFIQEKEIPETGGTLRAHGRVSLRTPNSLRWEYLSPVKTGFVLSGNASASWTEAGGEGYKSSLHENPRADDIARLVIACLVFNEHGLRKRCIVDVMPGNRPTVRLTPKNDLARSYFSEIEVTFSRDGQRPRAARVTMARGSNTRFSFSNILRGDALLRNPASLEGILEGRERAPLPGGGNPVPEKNGGPRLFSAMLSEQGRRLPLLVHAWESTEKEVKTLRCVVFTETLFRLGSAAASRNAVTVSVQVPDSQAERVLTRVGTAMKHLFPAVGKAENGAAGGRPMRYGEEGWNMKLLPVEMAED